MRIGIVGAEGAKFTTSGEQRAKDLIFQLIRGTPNPIVVSGGCHLGGVDIWAEQSAKALSVPTIIHTPKHLSWEGGYKPRNILIAQDSEIVHVITVNKVAPDFPGRFWPYCYHCETGEHVKSGGCWTARYGMKSYGHDGKWHIIDQLLA